MRRDSLLIPLAALAIVLPLLAHGCSCGHDFGFHLQSWLEAASQFRQGTLYPHWAFASAYNAGEPRFVFYPPLSWTLGAILTLLLPAAATTTAYTLLALTAAGFTMYRLGSYFAPPRAALVATTLYLANPYMLFTAFERTAFAELLAAAWLPLLFLAALRRRPTVTGIALPVALLWLTNAPAAVMGCYAFAVIIAVRLVAGLRGRHNAAHTAGSATPAPPSPFVLAGTALGGTALGLSLAAIYLVPAAYERRFVQIAMAIIPNMRFEDNFLFGHTADAPHNAVLHTASAVALELLAATAVALAAMYVLTRVRAAQPPAATAQPTPLPALAILTLLIALLLLPLSTPVWRHLPELAFLQFPWRMLSILAVCLALTVALVLSRPTLLLAPSRRASAMTLLLCASLLAALVTPAIHVFRQPCEDDDLPARHAQLFRQHHGVEPTDEYTPTQADNDVLRADDPPYWLSGGPQSFAAHTTPNPATLADRDALNAAKPDETAIPAGAGTPLPTTQEWQFDVDLPPFQTIVLNTRDYPNWDVTVVGESSMSSEHPQHEPRDDGLIAVRLASGKSTIYVDWQRSADEYLGDALSLAALGVFATLCFRARSGKFGSRGIGSWGIGSRGIGSRRIKAQA